MLLITAPCFSFLLLVNISIVSFYIIFTFLLEKTTVELRISACTSPLVNTILYSKNVKIEIYQTIIMPAVLYE
jgi:hypothetical protein